MSKSPTSDTSSSFGGTDQKSLNSKTSGGNNNGVVVEEGGEGPGRGDIEPAVVDPDALVAMETDDVAVETMMPEMMVVKNGGGGTGGGEEEDEEIYKCDICAAAFTGIADFMDHRNFDCEPSKCYWCFWQYVTRSREMSHLWKI